MPGFLLLFGSQTGQAKAVAQDIAQESQDHGIECELMCMEDYKADKDIKMPNQKVVVIICSSTGEGDAPDNASRFWRRIKKKSHAPDQLSHIKYTVLGLGDTNWSTYQAVPMFFFKRMGELGATCFYDPGYADDGVGLELVIEPWKAGLWDPLKKSIMEDGGDSSAVSSVSKTNDNKPKTHAGAITVDEKQSLVVDTEPSSNPDIARLVEGLPQIEELKLPKLQPSFLQRNILDNRDAAFEDVASSDKYKLAVLKSHRVLTTPDAVKRTIEVVLEWPEAYIPGDTFCLACPNDEDEVNALMKRLSVLDQADEKFSFVLDPKTKKKRAEVPAHLLGSMTIRECLTAHLDIRTSLTKSNLCVLADLTKNNSDRLYLSYLCSRQGSAAYMDRLQSQSLSLASILELCPSCDVTFERIAELLPQSKPRRYSAASSPLADSTIVRFILNTVDKGLCSNWLDNLGLGLTSPVTDGAVVSQDPVPRATSVFAIKQMPNAPRVPMYREVKVSGCFHPPEDVSAPMILIGPGTGIAPFLGFLQHRHCQRQESTDKNYGQIWLFFGNRNEAKDHLCREEIDHWVTQNTLSKCHTCFSRDESASYKYVQDHFTHCGEDLIRLMCDEGAYLYVCGNSNGVVDSVGDEFGKLLMKHREMTRDQAINTKIEWKERGRYKVEHFAG